MPRRIGPRESGGRTHRRLITILLPIVLAGGSCSTGADSADATAAPAAAPPISSATPTTTSTLPPWPEVPDWAEPMAAYMEAYRLALGSGDIDEIYPFLAEDVSWWSGEPGDRFRFGLRDTLIGVAGSTPATRLPGVFFVLAVGVEGGIVYDIDWIHEALPAGGCPDPEACRSLEAVHLTIGLDGVSAYGARSLSADADGNDPQVAAEVDRIEARYAEIADRMSSGDPDYAAGMISPRPVWRDIDGTLERVDPREQWVAQSGEAFASRPDAVMETMTTADLGFGGTPRPLVFFTTSDEAVWFSERTVGGIGVYRWAPTPTESYVVAVEWLEQPQGIIDFALKLQPAEFPVVLPDEVNPWIADPSFWPAVPATSHQLTGAIEVGDAEILVYNGSESQDDLLRWALDRFAAAGLPLPRPRTIGFPPDAGCLIYAGLAIDTGEGVDLQLCFDEEESCRGDACTPTLSAQSTLLHELGHVWTIQYADEARRAAFLEVRGLEVWSGPEANRDESGTEHAAEIISWGLLEVDNWPARLPDNACPDLAAAFRALTGREPLRTCPAGGG